MATNGIRQRLGGAIGHVGLALVDQAAVSGANFLLAILLARYLGLDEFGRYSVAFSAMWFVGGLQWALIISPMMSIGPKTPEDEQRAWFGAVLVQQAIASGVGFAVLWGGSWLADLVRPDWQLGRYGAALAFAGFAVQWQDFMRGHFFARQQTHLVLINDLVCHGGRIGALVYLLEVYAIDSVDVLWCLAATAGVAVVVAVPSLTRPDWQRVDLGATTRRHWAFARWLSASTILAWISEHFFVVLAGSVLGATQAGALLVAEQPMRILAVLYQGLNNIVPVYASRIFARDGRDALSRFTGRVAALGAIPIAAVILLLSVFADDVLAVLFKPEYREHAWIVRVFGLIYIVTWFETPFGAALRALEDTRTIFGAFVAPAMLIFVGLYPALLWQGLAGGLALLLPAAILRQVTLGRALRQRLQSKSPSTHR